MFRRGRYYVYNGSFEIEKLKDFALDTYDKSKNQGVIPVPPTAFQ